MAADFSLPSVVLFFEGTGRLEVFQEIVSGLRRGGRRVQVFVAGTDAPFRPHPQPRLGDRNPETALQGITAYQQLPG